MLAVRVRMGLNRNSDTTRLLFSTTNIESRSESSCYYNRFVYSSGYSGIIEKFDMKGNKVLTRQVGTGNVSDKLISNIRGATVNGQDVLLCATRFTGVIMVDPYTLEIIQQLSTANNTELFKTNNGYVIFTGSSLTTFINMETGEFGTKSSTRLYSYDKYRGNGIGRYSTSALRLYSDPPDVNDLDTRIDLTSAIVNNYHTIATEDYYILTERNNGVKIYNRSGTLVHTISLSGTTWEIKEHGGILYVCGSSGLIMYRLSDFKHLGILEGAGTSYRNIAIHEKENILTACGDSGLVAYKLGGN